MLKLVTPAIQPPETGLSTEAMKSLDEMVERRMVDTGETLYQAREHVANYLMALIGD